MEPGWERPESGRGPAAPSRGRPARRAAALVPWFLLALFVLRGLSAMQADGATADEARHLAYGERVPIIGETVQLWHLRNTGAAFSILPGAVWLFIPITIIALGMVIHFHRQFRHRGAWIHVILGAILAGSLGNLTDRVRWGYVVDFVSVGIGDLRWPAFNVADPAVVGGIILLVVYLTFFAEEEARSRDEPAA